MKVHIGGPYIPIWEAYTKVMTVPLYVAVYWDYASVGVIGLSRLDIAGTPRNVPKY